MVQSLLQHRSWLKRPVPGAAWFALWFWAASLSGWAAPSLTASLDRDSVPLGETVTLSLTFEGGGPNGPPNLPKLPNLQVAGVSQSSQFNIINGQMSSQKTFSYTLVPTQAGDVTIPAITVVLGGKPVSSRPMPLKILPAGASATPQSKLNEQAFLRLIVPKTEVYVGEAFPVEIQLYWRNGQDIRTPQLKADGFSLSPNPQHSQTRTQVGNAIYNLLVFRLAATAARSGDLALGPAQCSMTVLLPLPRQPRRDSFFDVDPLDFFGGRMQGRAVNLTSDPVKMKVLPLPTQDVPETFNGAVGQFSMAVTAGPTTLNVGDPITVKASLSGRGLLDALALPPQPSWRDFKVYPPTSRIQSNDPLGLTGTKSFEQVVIPQNHEIKALPPLLFSYFDPVQRSYRTLSNAPVALTVGQAAQVASPPPALTNAPSQAPPPADDIVHIKALPDGVMAWQTPLVYRPAFLVLQGVPAAVWLALLFRRKRRESLANNPKLRRQRQVLQRVREGIQELHASAGRQNSEAFFATLFRILQEQLGERLDLPAAAITEAVLEERLQARNVSESTLHTLHELFQTCNQVRYAPHRSGQELEALVPRVETVVRELQQLRA
jgi:BatD DUF11 like domain